MSIPKRRDLPPSSRISKVQHKPRLDRRGAGPPHQFEGAPPKLAWVGQLGSRR